ncbi:MAG: phosphatase PAP2 family protein [Bacteroidales bacterium]|nr:phosphatase PAP2 family protein [Bacteroidales bacterium]
MKRIFGIVLLLTLSIVSSLAQTSSLSEGMVNDSPKVKETRYPETFVQYAPVTMDILLPVVGVDSNADLKSRITKAVLAYGFTAVVSRAGKMLIDEERPDGSAHNSFPSGHTATAFTGAELLRQDCGNLWGIPGYAAGIYTGSMRVVHKRHFWWDTAAGAAIGIGSAVAAKALTPLVVEHVVDPVLDWMFPNRSEKGENSIAFAPSVDPLTGAKMMSFVLVF